MRIVRYNAAKLALAACAGIAMAVLGATMLGADRGKTQFLGFVFVLIGPFLTLATAKTLLGDRVALRIASDSLQLNTLWRRRLLGWSEVEEIAFRTVNSYALYGLFKTSSTRVLSIKTKGGLLGSKKLDLSRMFLDLSDAEYYALPEAMAAIGRGQPTPAPLPAMQSGFGRGVFGVADVTGDPRAPALAMAAPGRVPAEPALTPEHDEPFDPDAALARYLAKKAVGESSEPLLNGEPIVARQPAPRPLAVGFGRKGL